MTKWDFKMYIEDLIYISNLDCKSLKSSSRNYRKFSAERKLKDKRIASLES